MDGNGQLDLALDLPQFVSKVAGVGDPNPLCP
jgi:hypothetical protein